MDYDRDAWRIYSAFLSQYHIDLTKENLHYWCFMALLTTLGECAFTSVVDVRRKKFSSKMSGTERARLKEAKARYGLQPVETEAEKAEAEAIRADFLARTKIHK